MPDRRETPEGALAETLTRIEVKVSETAKDITNVLEKVTGIGVEVVQHRDQIVVIKSEVQQLQSDAKAAAKAVIDAETARLSTAKLLKEATEKTLKEAKEADDKKVFDAKTLVEQSSTTWSRSQTIAVIGGLIVAIIVGVFGIVWAIKTGTPPSAVRLP